MAILDIETQTPCLGGRMAKRISGLFNGYGNGRDRGELFYFTVSPYFAEPGRKIKIGNNCFIAADCSLHGPLEIGNEVAINHHCILDGGRAGIKLHDQVRIAAYCHLYAFDHGMQLDRPLYQQPVRSQGIEIEKDVWLGAHVGIKDGIKIGKHAVVGMNSMVTKDVEPYHIVGGNPAKFIRLRE